MNKYEQLIEYIINDQEDKARELFHNIVVEKSRDIYESLMDEDQVDENIDQYDQQGDLAADIQNDENGGLGENDDEMGDIELDGGDDMGNDDGFGGDDMGDDIGGDDFGADDMGGEGDVEGKFQDIKSAIDELQAEFDKLMGGEGDGTSGTGSDEFGGEEEVGGDEFGAEEEVGAEDESMYEAKSGSGNPFAKKGSGSGVSGSGKSGSGKSGSGNPFAKKGSGSGKAMTETEMMREYVEKISAPSNTEFTPVGTGTGGDKAAGLTKGIVAGKNDMGGTTANIAKGGANEAPDGQSPKGKAGGFVKPAQEIDVAKRNVNKVGGNKGAQDFYGTKAKAKTGEGQTTDGSVPVSKNSLEGGKK